MLLVKEPRCSACSAYVGFLFLQLVQCFLCVKHWIVQPSFVCLFVQSRMVRSVSPSLFWVLKRDVIDYRFLGKDQMVNHYCKAGSFTTKVCCSFCQSLTLSPHTNLMIAQMYSLHVLPHCAPSMSLWHVGQFMCYLTVLLACLSDMCWSVHVCYLTMLLACLSVLIRKGC